MKKLAYLFLLVICVSCGLLQEKGIAFEIINTSDFPITEIKISTSENLDSVTFASLEKNESQEGFLSMKNNKTDGSYALAYTIIGVHKEILEGYYTNGAALDKDIRFEIQNDTTLVKFGEFVN